MTNAGWEEKGTSRRVGLVRSNQYEDMIRLVVAISQLFLSILAALENGRSR